MRWPWSGDLDRFLASLPSPLFRMADAYDLADRLHIDRPNVQHIWYELRRHGRILRTQAPIGKSTVRCYWERSHCSVRVNAHNRHVVAYASTAANQKVCSGVHLSS